MDNDTRNALAAVILAQVDMLALVERSHSLDPDASSDLRKKLTDLLEAAKSGFS
jgi:energy-coupling factor transporter ATP-binding protein EcfA2